ncbi:MAG: thioredoxin domain-containing protein, partial [Deltaproteobacteria bacterium]|nr:thioredoxin domain-containing protein [Deltaproteobacteria bacterium]
LMAPSLEIVISGKKGSADTEAMLDTLRHLYLPGAVILFRPPGDDSQDIVDLVPFTRDQRPVDGRSTAYICTAQACQRPVTDVSEMLALLRISPPPSGLPGEEDLP